MSIYLEETKELVKKHINSFEFEEIHEPNLSEKKRILIESGSAYSIEHQVKRFDKRYKTQ